MKEQSAMNCNQVKDLLALHLYGELSFEEEEAIESHLPSCPSCQTEQDSLRRLHASLDERELMPSFEDLSQCRRELRQQIAASSEASDRRPFWKYWLPDARNAWVWKPIAAMALFAAGFVGARLTPEFAPEPSTNETKPPVARNVRLIERAEDGELRIIFDEVRQQEFSGHLEDRRVRDLLMAATNNTSDPALRVDSVEYLAKKCEREEVRQALVETLTADPDEAVRLKVIEALRPYAAQGDVRQALAKVLLADQSATVRTQAVDLLVNGNKHGSELAGVLQELMQREQNSYIRQRSQSALRAMNASVESF